MNDLFLNDQIITAKREINKKMENFAYDINYVIFEHIAAKRRIIYKKNRHLDKMKRFREKIFKF